MFENRPKSNIQKLRAKRATIIFWVDKSALKMPKMIQLWSLAKAKAAEEPKYLVDDIIKEAGYTPLRLPPYLWDLNPIEWI